MAGTTSASVTDTYGAFLIGTYCALMLYGLVLHQSYHYYRVYAADARWIKALVTVTLILETIVTALNMNAAFQAHNITEALDFSYLVSARNTAATVADSFMTAVLIYSLQRSRTGIKRTDSMINVLVLYAINTGLLISAFNVLCLIFGFVFPQSFTYIAVDLVASRLYANSLHCAPESE
ncbi:hypothetical protein GSI_05552 [Ganoderma sinense ZZ0214-1]|uniref:DUF6534 domain-containing protein n=1 Tax=Ganoderma sinense ZZ0214-1 TaxID=1077348 RepID=A0A2G8SEW0_9APHY|nr:hypothetical protein GSI_05552 [Ganoderma sinense ZZ0214-1]